MEASNLWVERCEQARVTGGCMVAKESMYDLLIPAAQSASNDKLMRAYIGLWMTALRRMGDIVPLSHDDTSILCSLQLAVSVEAGETPATVIEHSQPADFQSPALS